jgi:hypothetical protein
MPTRAPEETDVLCENCGYMLNGLPASGNCPECGTTIETSVSERLRQPPLWEAIGDSRPITVRFWLTTLQIIFTPTRFFRGVTSRGQIQPAHRFAQIHWAISALLLGLAARIHFSSEWELHFSRSSAPVWLGLLLLVGLPVVVYLALVVTIRLAARLTAWEANYRGFRLPHGVVLRALYYHSAHILPVAMIAFATCAIYYYLLENVLRDRITSEPIYLYILSGEVIVAAAYLFYTYWIGMRNWMYANR